MNRFLFLIHRLNQSPLVQLIFSLIILACALTALYGVVIFIHEHIGDWYFVACGVSLLILARAAKNAPHESELWPDKK